MNNLPSSAKPLDSVFITNLSHDGRGIAHINAKITFVEGALPGEEVTIEYLHKRSKYDEAKVVSILKASEDRVVPSCPHFDICGGCSLQHLNPKAQILFKQSVLLEQLKHFANLVPEKILPPLTGENLHYRRKARLGVKFVIKKNKLLIGFHERNGRYLADLQSCVILRAEIGTKLEQIAKLIYSLSIYDSIPQIEIACGDENIALILRCLKPPTTEDLEKIRQISEKYVWTIYLQNKGLDSIELFNNPTEEDLTYKLFITPDKDDKYKLDDVSIVMHFTPIDFIQVNSSINQKMVRSVINLLDLQKEDSVLDLFCGLGNFTLPIALHSREVVGIEGETGLVNRAYKNAEFNGIINVKFYKADLTKENDDTVWQHTKYNKILLDPPRTGAETVCTYIAKFNAKKIVYVSCNPATLARDCKILSNQGYVLTKVGVLDMFPHTSHVESIAVFDKL